MGTNFEQFEDVWSKNFAALKQFQVREGHASVQHGFVEHFNGEDLNLGAWVSQQRKFCKKGTLSSERVALLQAVVFEFDRHEAKWQKNYAALKQYIEREGNANVSRGHVEPFDGEDLKLGVWVSSQRTARKKGTLSSERVKLLQAVGFEFDRYEVKWQKNYSALKQYVERVGNANVPQDHVESFDDEDLRLGSWVNSQRTFFKKGKLSSERVTLLQAVGFEFDPKKSFWPKHYAALQQYVEREGNTNVPQDHVESFNSEDLKLGRWVRSQRTFFKRGTLPAERVTLLQAVGFEFDPYEATWQKSYSALKQYVERVGNANVPQGRVEPFDGEDLNLGTWVSTQRTDFKKEKLSSERVTLLQAVGFEFGPKASFWPKSYSALQQYVERVGNANVPQGRVEPFDGEDLNLGTWVRTQRQAFKKGTLPSERVTLLQAVGFEFDPNESFWQKSYSALKQYVEDAGNANVPYRHVESFDGEDLKLGTWVSNQRQERKNGKLDPERERLLGDLPDWRW